MKREKHGDVPMTEAATCRFIRSGEYSSDWCQTHDRGAEECIRDLERQLALARTDECRFDHLNERERLTMLADSAKRLLANSQVKPHHIAGVTAEMYATLHVLDSLAPEENTAKAPLNLAVRKTLKLARTVMCEDVHPLEADELIAAFDAELATMCAEEYQRAVDILRNASGVARAKSKRELAAGETERAASDRMAAAGFEMAAEALIQVRKANKARVG